MSSSRMLLPEPRVRYADDSYKAYSRQQLVDILRELGFLVIFDQDEEAEFIERYE